MKALNLYTLTRMRDPEEFPVFEKHLSGRATVKNANSHEQESLRLLVDEVLAAGSESGLDAASVLPLLDGFYFSYTISHISKEFDLLKLSRDQSAILNCELKSDDIGEDRVREQLQQNRYYLRHIARRIYSFTYVSSTKTLYTLNHHGYLVRAEMSDLLHALSAPALKKYIDANIDAYFETAGYLISPINNPDRYLGGQYFLTNQQWEFRKKILDVTKSGRRPVVLAICGNASTGKTLMLYDLALHFSRHHKVCLLHCGPLARGHRTIDRRLKNLTIRTPEGETAHSDLLQPSDCEYLLIDETARLTDRQFRDILEEARFQNKVCIFTYDPDRFLFADADGDKLRADMQTYADCTYTLSGNIRINQGLTAFRRCLFSKRDIPSLKYPMEVIVLYANDEEEEGRLKLDLQEQGFSVIDSDANHLVGRELNQVAVVLDEKYYYDAEDHLCGGKTKESSRRAMEFLYDGTARARERLCLIVRGNPEVFRYLLEVVSRER